MNENQDIQAPDNTPLPAAPAEPPSAGRTLTAHFDINLALIVAVVALLLLALLWINQRQAFEALQLEVSKRLASTQTATDETKRQVDRNVERLQDTNSRLAVLENKLTDTQNQQDAMTAMYQNLAQHRQDWLVAEAEQTLVLAQQQLRIAGNIPAALTALQTLEQRLGEVEDPKVSQLRAAIVGDIGRLKALPYVDTVQVARQIDYLISRIDTLPLSVDHLGNHEPKPEQAEAEKLSPMQKLGRELWGAISELISVRRIDQSDPAVMSPEQSYFIRQNLRLRLAEARLLLIQRNAELFRSDIATARQTLVDYFDKHDDQVKAAVQQLARLQALDLAAPSVDFGGSIAMTRELLRTPKPAIPANLPAPVNNAASTPAAPTEAAPNRVAPKPAAAPTPAAPIAGGRP